MEGVKGQKQTSKPGRASAEEFSRSRRGENSHGSNGACSAQTPAYGQTSSSRAVISVYQLDFEGWISCEHKMIVGSQKEEHRKW